MEEINHDRLKGKIEMDADWKEGINAFRKWCTDEINLLRSQIESLKKESK